MFENNFTLTNEFAYLDSIIKKDTLLTLSMGAYDDYTVSQVFLVNVTFNIDEVAKNYWYQYAEKEYKENPDDFWVFSGDVQSSFINYLLEQDYISQVEQRRVYMGDEHFFDSYKWEEDFKKEKGIE